MNQSESQCKTKKKLLPLFTVFIPLLLMQSVYRPSPHCPVQPKAAAGLQPAVVVAAALHCKAIPLPAKNQ